MNYTCQYGMGGCHEIHNTAVWAAPDDAPDEARDRSSSLGRVRETQGFLGNQQVANIMLGMLVQLVANPYSWWKKSCTTWDVILKPVNNGINYLPTGAGFLSSTVGMKVFEILVGVLLFGDSCVAGVCHVVYSYHITVVTSHLSHLHHQCFGLCL